MVTAKSPLKVIRSAHQLGGQLFDDRSHKFSPSVFTLPQLFACLVLREHQKKSYRGIEALLADSSDLRNAIDLTRTPDHNTLCRAFKYLVKSKKMNSALDLTVAQGKAGGLDVSGDSIKPATMDSTCFESRHVSRHFERRKRQSARQARRGRTQKKARNPANLTETGAGPEPCGGCRNFRLP
jgi:hypothetical protein